MPEFSRAAGAAHGSTPASGIGVIISGAVTEAGTQLSLSECFIGGIRAQPLHPKPARAASGYSYLSAAIGSRRLARMAGM